MKKVSVIVPCYNVSSYLDRCMKHLIGQTIGIENIEIILVDDASTDGGETWRLITEYEQKFPKSIIAISLEENMRQGGARNIGITYAGGEYLMFCDADDWLSLDAMNRLYQTALKYNADVVEYRMQKVSDNTDFSSILMDEGEESHLLALDDEIRKNFLLISKDNCSLGCMRKFYRMSMIKENGIRFVEHLICEEPSFTLPVRLYEKRHYFLDQLLYFYYMNPQSTVHSNWEEDNRKLDNLQVWLLIYEDLERRNFLQKYYHEIEYMFFKWQFELSIMMILRRGYNLQEGELIILIDSLIKLFPNVRKNEYVCNCNSNFSKLLLTVLDMEINAESVQVVNQILRKYI